MKLSKAQLSKIHTEIEQLITACQSMELKYNTSLSKVHPKNRQNARNLIHYLALRNHDVRTLQDNLSNIGLSSLGRAESHVLYNLLLVHNLLQQLQGKSTQAIENCITIQESGTLLVKHTTALFKKSSRKRRVRIMVTLPIQAASDYSYVKQLVAAGMDIARINCAHDAPDDWLTMIQNVRKAVKAVGTDCPVFMDLAGPKLRTAFLDRSYCKRKYTLVAGNKVQLIGKSYNEKPKCEIVYGCTLETLFTKIKKGESIKLDDGKIEGTVTETGSNYLIMKVLHTGPEGATLKKDKSINLPDSKLDLYGLTPKDHEDLRFIANHADGVNASFVNRPEDVIELLDALAINKVPNLPFILKIETQEGFKKLPHILLEAMKGYPFGVFIARGDLAVECGWERMAEIQEEILWLCEAGCVPIIWGTQVLENLVKNGIPSRAEITDAAMSQRAECVMLNKGPFVSEAIKMLDRILVAMQSHQQKKVSSLRKLSIADI